uniref:FBD domain-containing protein n=1 Tax=Kalanchoe fedtschenkoi TaxID=63787 RepID=A0A7N0UPX5_KALFE
MDRQRPFNFLPKELLINIVSRLPFKDAVRTSVLAKNWINIWRNSTNMELNQSFFRNPKSHWHPGSIDSARFKLFSNKFMTYFLGSELNSFTLKVSAIDRSLKPMLKRALLFAIKHRVKHLTLDLPQPLWNQQHPLNFETLEILDLPNEFYDYLTKVESLKLSSVISISLFGCSRFTALRSVSLQLLRFWKAELRHLVAEAPLLEDLRLRKCVCYKLKLASNSLRNFAVEECDIVKDTVSITSPNLESFVFSGRACKLDLESAAKNLKSASIQFDFERLKQDFDENLVCYHLKNFWCVKDLTICSYILQLLQSGMGDFNHHHQPLELKHLTIKADSFNRSVFQGCIFFVKSCPDMETLTINISRASESLSGRRAPLNLQPYSLETFEDDHITCLVRSLKVVKLIGFDGSCLQVKFLSYILKKGKLLENIILKSSTDERNIKKLQCSEKASPNVQICIQI